MAENGLLAKPTHEHIIRFAPPAGDYGGGAEGGGDPQGHEELLRAGRGQPEEDPQERRRASADSRTKQKSIAAFFNKKATKTT